MSRSTLPPGAIVLLVISAESATVKSEFATDMLFTTRSADPEFVPTLNLVFSVVSPSNCGI